MNLNLRARRREDPEINLINFIDVLLVLLIFFTQAVSGMARMEVNREWIYTIVYLAPLAGASAATLRGRWAVPLLACLALVQAGFIEMVWIDAN